MRSIVAGAALAACIGALGCEGGEAEPTTGARGAASATAAPPAETAETTLTKNETVVEIQSGVQTAAELVEKLRTPPPVTSSRPVQAMRRSLPEQVAVPGGAR